MVAWAAAAPAIIKGVAALGSAALGAFGSRSGGSSALSIEDQEHLMDYQWELNQKTAATDNVYNKLAEQRQFKYNKWFAQNAYQNSVADLRAAGLNPLLVNPSGASGAVGLSNTSAPGAGLLDPASVTSANAQKLQAKLGVIGAINGTLSSISNAAKSFEEAKTEANKRNNLDMDSALKNLQGMKQIIENSNLDSKMKAEIQESLTRAELNLTELNYKNAILPYDINERSASAKSMLQNASSNSVSSQANYINATQGNWQKALIDMVSGMTGQNPKQLGRTSSKVLKFVGDTSLKVIPANRFRK